MKYRALATDYDGTIATAGIVDHATLAALESARDAGLLLVLVTGRELPSLFATFHHPAVFHRIVAENGAVIHNPATGSIDILGSPPPEVFLESLKRRNVPYSTGHCIVATTRPYECMISESIATLGLRWQMIRNKDAVMALPEGLSKASGLKHALSSLGVLMCDAVGIGDAENDLAFLHECATAVAVANALPVVKAAAHLVTDGARGCGVQQLIEQILPVDAATA